MGTTITDEMAAETPEALAERRAALAKQLAEVDARLVAEKVTTKAQAIADIGALMLTHSITVADLTDEPATRAAKGEPRQSALAGVKVAPKYRDPATGKTWSGRGLQPAWVDREAMRIAA